MKIKSIISILLTLILVFATHPLGVFAESETIYYVSVSGSDSNTGLSESQPLKTIDAVNNLSLSSGTKVLFKRGDIWRGETLYCQPNVYYGAYGSGENPAFYGSYQNYAREEYWTLTETENVYSSTFTLDDDIGAIVFDNDSWVGVRYVTTSNSADLYKNGMFIVIDEDEDDSVETNRIYLYNDSGNPGLVYSEMEFIQHGTLIEGKSLDGVYADGITVEDITLKYGNYGYHVNGTQKDVVLRRLNISFIGGKYISNGARGGNAIEFYGDSENILTEDCVITQVYDTAFTCQMYGGKNRYFKDITLRNCDISYCHWTTEFWFRPYNEPLDYCTIDNVNITGNSFSYAGYGFGTELRYTENDTNKATFMNTLIYENYYSVDINISDNIFNGTKHYFFYSEFGDFTPTFSNNTYILTDDSMPGHVNGTLDTAMGHAVTQMSFETDAEIKYANKITGTTLATAYNTMGNSDFENDFAAGTETENNWFSENTPSFSTEDKVYGERALNLSGNSVTGNFDVYSATPYTVGFWYKGSAEVTVKDADGNVLSSADLSGSDWEYHKLYFTTPEEVDKVYITLAGDSLYDRMLLSPYPAKQILSFQNGIAVLDDVFYTEGENAEFTVLPEKGYELENTPVIACSDGSFVSSVYTESTKKVNFTAPDGSVYITCYFRKDGYIRGENLLSDSGFDKGSDETPWGIYWSTELSTAPYDYAYIINKTGDSCIKLNNYSGGIYQAFSVEEGCTYELSFLWAPCVSGGSTTKMRVTVGDNYGSYSSSLNFVYNQVVSSQNKRYEKFTDMFTATSTGTVYLRLERANYTPAVYVDDISVCKLTDENAPKIYPITVSQNIKNGTLSLSSSEAKAGETVIIEPVSQSPYVLKEGTVTAFTENETLEILSLEGTENYYFIMPESAVTVSAEFEFRNVSASGSVNILKDSTCQNGIGTDWLQLWGSVDATATSDFTSDKIGDSCIKIPNYQGGVQQAVNVVEGKSYEFSFLWAPCASDDTLSKMNIAIGDKYGDNPTGKEFMLYETISSYNFRYERYTTSFTATKTGTVYVRFDRHDCSPCTVYLDDITLTTDYSVSLDSEEMFTDEDYIFEIADGMTAEQVIDSFSYDNCEFKFDGEGDIKTGDTFTLYVSDTAVLTRTAAVEGDCNSDGNVDLLDFVALKKHCANSRSFNTAEMYAIRIDGCWDNAATSLCAVKKMLLN